MSSSSTNTTMRIMQAVAPVALSRTAGPVPGATPVDIVFQILFSKFSVREWPNFMSNARAVFAFENAKSVSSETRNDVHSLVRHADLDFPPADEVGVSTRLDCGVLKPVNAIQSDVSPGQASHRWIVGNQRNLSVPQGASVMRPDLTYSAEGERPMIVGEIKSPQLRLNRSCSEVEALIQRNPRDRNVEKLPFLQIASYMFGSKKGLGILTNFSETLCFRLDLENKVIEMSPCLRVERRLSSQHTHAHIFQAFLHMSDIISSLDDLDKNLTEQLYSKAAKEHSEMERADVEKKARKKGSRRDKGGSGAGGSRQSVPAGSARSWDMPLPKGDVIDISPYVDTLPMRRPPMDKNINVTLVMYESSKRKFLGWGLCGVTTERDYKGSTYAFKGAPTYIRDGDEDARDAKVHLQKEIIMYEELRELQGKVIPKMLGWGEEHCFHPEYLFLVVQKVGVGLSRKGGRVHIDGVPASDENIELLKEKGVAALRAMHDMGAVHGDIKLENMRVEMDKGKVSKVWLIDIGKARMYYSDETPEMEEAVLIRVITDPTEPDTLRKIEGLDGEFVDWP